MSQQTKVIIVTGGVISSVGKGVAAAALSSILQGYGYSTRIKKFDPYLNVDPGTMSPAQHGEVYVTDDGAETDMDAGHYERIGGARVTSADYIAMGAVMHNILQSERAGKFSGQTVQVVPHVTDFIKERFLKDVVEDVVICEIGGTVGDIEILPFLESARQIAQDYHTAFVHITYLMKPCWTEVKTKPAQHSVTKLREYGIHPDILGCRTEYEVSEATMQKLGHMCGIPRSRVILMQNNPCLYLVPQQYRKLGLGGALTEVLKLRCSTDHNAHQQVLSTIDLPRAEHTIGIVTKYTNEDAHQSLTEAIFHAGVECKSIPKVRLIDAEKLESSDSQAWDELRECSGIVVAGGFGNRGINGKLRATKYAREKEVPYLGICLGMQLCIIESLRANNIDADSSEFDPNTSHPAICLVEKWVENGQVKLGVDSQSGGTMRLGAHRCVVSSGAPIFTRAYGTTPPTPRHRHRYEVNPVYEQQINNTGLVIAARSEDGLIEGVELNNHPWFVGVQYHPEFTSRLSAPEPIILDFVRHALIKKN
jgi:CTP synthase